MAYIGKSPSGLGVRTRYYYTATGGETSLSGADDNGRVLKFTDGEYIDVYLNGVLLVAGTDYGTGTANTISSLDALSAGNIVEIVAYDIHSLAKPNLEALRKRYYKTATGGETSISGNDDSGAAITFAANAEIEVYLNGVALVQGDDYNTTTANTVGGLAALDADDIVSIVAYEEFTLGDVVSKKSGGTFASDVTFSQDISVGVNATVTGDLTVDTDTLVVDSTNNRVGINVGSPDHPLRVSRAGFGTIAKFSSDDGTNNPRLLIYGSSDGMHIQRTASTGATSIIFENGGAEGSGTERMRISAAGELGLGVTSTTGGAGDINMKGNQAIRWMHATNGTQYGDIYVDTSNNMVFRNTSNSTERMRIDSSGEIYIDGSGRASANNGAYTALRNGDSDNIETYRIGTGTRSHHNFYNGTFGSRAFVGSIKTSGSSTSYNTTSDHRLKENIADLTGAITRVKTLSPKRFNFIGLTDTVDGFLAHEAQTVVPEAVHGTHNEVETWTQDEIDAGDAPANTSAGDNKLDGEGNTIPVYQGIDQAKLVPLLTAALQEAITKIEALETENADFETRIAALEAN